MIEITRLCSLTKTLSLHHASPKKKVQEPKYDKHTEVDQEQEKLNTPKDDYSCQ